MIIKPGNIVIFPLSTNAAVPTLGVWVGIVAAFHFMLTLLPGPSDGAARTFLGSCEKTRLVSFEHISFSDSPFSMQMIHYPRLTTAFLPYLLSDRRDTVQRRIRRRISRERRYGTFRPRVPRKDLPRTDPPTPSDRRPLSVPFSSFSLPSLKSSLSFYWF